MRRVAAEAKADTDFSRYLAEVEDDDPTPPRNPVRQPRRQTHWNRTWSQRARAIRNSGGRERGEFEAERSALLAMESAAYVEVLTGEQPHSGGKLRCVLPDHDERTGSFVVYPDDGGWYCFGCSRGGTVYDLAAALWGLDTRGPQFREIHERLLRIFKGAA